MARSAEIDVLKKNLVVAQVFADESLKDKEKIPEVLARLYPGLKPGSSDYKSMFKTIYQRKFVLKRKYSEKTYSQIEKIIIKELKEKGLGDSAITRITTPLATATSKPNGNLLSLELPKDIDVSDFHTPKTLDYERIIQKVSENVQQILFLYMENQAEKIKEYGEFEETFQKLGNPNLKNMFDLSEKQKKQVTALILKYKELPEAPKTIGIVAANTYKYARVIFPFYERSLEKADPDAGELMAREIYKVVMTYLRTTTKKKFEKSSFDKFAAVDFKGTITEEEVKTIESGVNKYMNEALFKGAQIKITLDEVLYGSIRGH
ncbi:MAG: hypothetical protein ACP5N3_02810 [Candidatus Nanoarchaeia archaeon]